MSAFKTIYDFVIVAVQVLREECESSAIKVRAQELNGSIVAEGCVKTTINSLPIVSDSSQSGGSTEMLSF